MQPESKLEQEVAALATSLAKNSQCDGRMAYGCPPPKGLKRGLLERAAAWHLQHKVLGGMSPAEEAEATELRGRTTKASTSAAPGKPFGRGNLYHLLSNPMYIGKIRHRDLIHDGEHLPLIDAAIFAKAQALLAAQAPARSSPENHADSHLLTGIIFDETGDRLSPTHANKQGKRYRYYVSNRLMEARKKGTDGWRIPAPQLEAMVEGQMNQIFSDSAQLADDSGHEVRIETALAEAARILGKYEFGNAAEKRSLLRKVLSRVELGREALSLEIDRKAVIGLLIPAGANDPTRQRSDFSLSPQRITVPIAMRRRGVETRLVLANGPTSAQPNPALITLIARAHCYLGKLTDGAGRNLTKLAAECETELSEISRILPLAFLSPAIVDASMAGRQAMAFTAQRLLRISELPLLWRHQVGTA